METPIIKRRKGESAEAFANREAMIKIESAFKRKASAMHGIGQSRNKRWRIAESERALTLNDDERW